MIDYSKIQPPTEVMRDNITQGNSGVPGMWNENTGMVNPTTPTRTLIGRANPQPFQQKSMLPNKTMVGSGWGIAPPPNLPLRYTAVMPRSGYKYVYNQQTGQRMEVPIGLESNSGGLVEQARQIINPQSNPTISMALSQLQSPAQSQGLDILSLIRMMSSGLRI